VSKGYPEYTFFQLCHQTVVESATSTCGPSRRFVQINTKLVLKAKLAQGNFSNRLDKTPHYHLRQTKGQIEIQPNYSQSIFETATPIAKSNHTQALLSLLSILSRFLYALYYHFLCFTRVAFQRNTEVDFFSMDGTFLSYKSFA